MSTKPRRCILLDMGEPVKIVELARGMIRITFSGLRPGEKLFEELLADADSTLPTAHPRLRIASLHANEHQSLTADLETGLAGHGTGVSDEAVKRWLQQHVPEYRPS